VKCLPNIKSAIKRVKTSAKKNTENTIIKSSLRTSIRKYKEAVEANDPQSAEMLKTTTKKIDQAASKGVIHKNTASRKISRLTKALNAQEK
jgi:small subunit ribosomal protein S20